MMNGRAKIDELFIPGFDLADKLARAIALACLAEQTVLLFYYLIVSRESVKKTWAAGHCSSIDEPAALTRIAANDIHLFEGEDKDGEIAKIARERLTLAVNE